jgi:glycosyltransferase involved in cell wall biosynthesis
MTEKCVALLGRRDTPTDAVEEYCQYLGVALAAENFALELVRVEWNELGWAAAVGELAGRAKEWRGRWILVQYTALAWSERGFPLRFLRVLRVLQKAGVRLAMVYHDPLPFSGSRTIDKLRQRAQVHVMSAALGASDLAIVTIPISKIPWIEKRDTPMRFIPVGANLPAPERAWLRRHENAARVPTVAVYGITGGQGGIWDLAKISEALRVIAERLKKTRIVVLGRNSERAAKALTSVAENLHVEVRALGVLPADEIVQWLGDSDVLLFVRAGISSRRGSAIAGIACGLPVVAFAGPETGPPITEAGVVLADPTNQRGFGDALLKVLTDEQYREALAEQSRRAQQEHFSWKAIAACYAQALRPMA